MTEVLEGQVDMFDLGIWSGKTYPALSAVTEGKTSKPSSKKSSKSSKQKSPICLVLSRGGWTKSGCLYSDMGHWSVAWRVHDAQFWGVPQRRKRIALVADFGGLSAPEILFERKGLSGDSEPSGTEREGTAAGAESGADSTITIHDKATRYRGGGAGRHDDGGGNGLGIGIGQPSPAISTSERHGVLSFQERAGKPGGGKGILIQHEHTGALSTLNNQSVCV